MPKKTGAKKNGAERRPREVRARVNGLKLTAVLALGLLSVGVAATRSPSLRRAAGLSPLTEPAPQATPQPLPLSKEYVYVGGRLVATEEPTTPLATPTPTPAGPPPSNLVATASLPTQNTAVVNLTWSAPTGSPTGYVVERAETRTADGPQYAPLAQTATTAPTAANPYVDQTAVQGKVYLYRVKATYAGGFSGFSNQDLATTYRYTGDDPLVAAGHPTLAPSAVRAANLTELRTVIEAVRALAGVGAGPWKEDPTPLLRGRILAAHFAELRTNLNPALAALGMSELPAPSGVGIAERQRVKAAHVQDVRDKVR